MDLDQTIINWVLGVCGAALGFLLRSLWEAVKDLQKADIQLARDVSKIREVVAGEYIKRDEFTHMCNAVFKRLDSLRDTTSEGFEKLYTRLDGKADKTNFNHQDGRT